MHSRLKSNPKTAWRLLKEPLSEKISQMHYMSGTVMVNKKSCQIEHLSSCHFDTKRQKAAFSFQNSVNPAPAKPLFHFPNTCYRFLWASSLAIDAAMFNDLNNISSYHPIISYHRVYRIYLFCISPIVFILIHQLYADPNTLLFLCMFSKMCIFWINLKSSFLQFDVIWCHFNMVPILFDSFAPSLREPQSGSRGNIQSDIFKKKL